MRHRANEALFSVDRHHGGFLWVAWKEPEVHRVTICKRRKGALSEQWQAECSCGLGMSMHSHRGAIWAADQILSTSPERMSSPAIDTPTERV